MFFTLFNMAGQQMQVVEYFSLSLDACRYHAPLALLYPPAFRTVLTLILSLLGAISQADASTCDERRGKQKEYRRIEREFPDRFSRGQQLKDRKSITDSYLIQQGNPYQLAEQRKSEQHRGNQKNKILLTHPERNRHDRSTNKS